MVQEDDMIGNDTGFVLNLFPCSFIQMPKSTYLQLYGMDLLVVFWFDLISGVFGLGILT